MKKLADKIKRVGLLANSDKVSCRSLVRKAATLIQTSNRAVWSDTATAQLAHLHLPTSPDAASLVKQVDLLMVFGGDGTMLRVAREIAGAATPILGINVGGLGFLTDVQAHQLPLALQQIWAGDIVVESRPLIEASAQTGGRLIEERALNDFVITRGAEPRLIELDVTVNNESLTRYRCDGLIVASPTGSTAYSLSAGGAVVSPGAEVFTLTPICPHTLSNRSVIVSLNSVIEVKVLSPHVTTVLNADGRDPTPLLPGDTVTIQRSQHAIRLLRLANSSFFDTLRRKLNWRGSNV